MVNNYSNIIKINYHVSLQYMNIKHNIWSGAGIAYPSGAPEFTLGF